MEAKIKKEFRNHKIEANSICESVKQLSEVQLIFSTLTRDNPLWTILIDKEGETIPVNLQSRISEFLKGNSEIKYRIYTVSYAKAELFNGNLYFIVNCHHSNLLYQSSQFNGELPFDYSVEHLLNKGREWLEKELGKPEAFIQGAKFYKKKKRKKHAAFLIHQSIELSYRTLETFAMGKPLVCHTIKNHQNYTYPFINEAAPIFNISRRSNVSLLDVLDRAYTETRYSTDYDVTKREIKILIDRAEIMVQQVREIFGFREKACLELLKCQKESTVQFKKKLEDSNHTVEKNETIEKILEKLVMLRPHDTYEGKYKFQELYMEGYGELFFTIRSLLFLCINSLEVGDFESYSVDRNPQNNILDVLELVTRIIPVDDGDVLDQLRRTATS